MPSIYTPPPEHPHLSGLDEGLLRAVALGAARLTMPQGLEIYRAMGLPSLGRFADARCRQIHGETFRTYVIDRNINYTNVCSAKCTFCAFRRDADDSDAYTLSHEALYDKVAELVSIGGTQILMQGGMNPNLPIDWYVKLLTGLKERFPGVHVHGFSPPEFIEFVHFFDPPGATLEEKIRSVMKPLRDAGLDSVPGGGGEIFSHAVRRKIGLGKCDAESWLTVMYVAHSLGMFTSATMMFGHIESPIDRIHHMALVRAWQDRALREGGASPSDIPPAHGADAQTGLKHRARAGFGHYKAFISWPFQRENTPLGRVPDWGADPTDLSREFPGDAIARASKLIELSSDRLMELDPSLPRGKRSADAYDFEAIDAREYPTAALFGKRVRMSGASDYLRTQALSRLFIDNVYSIGASWVTMGPHVGQVALAYGANDMGSVMMEENVVSSAGTTYCLDEAVLCRLIRDAGFVPAQRDNVYDLLRIHAGPDAPDRRVTDWSKHRARKMHQEAPRAPKPTAKATLTVSASGAAGARAEN